MGNPLHTRIRDDRRLLGMAILGVVYIALVLAFTNFIVTVTPIYLLTVWFEAPASVHAIHEVAFQTLLLITMVAVAIQFVDPEAHAGALQASIALWILGNLALIAGMMFQNLVLGGLFLALQLGMAWLHPRRERILQVRGDGRRPDLVLVGLAAVILLVGAPYVMDEYTTQLSSEDEHSEVGHYLDMVWAVLALPLLVTLDALRPGESRFAAWGAASLGVLMGASFIMYPNLPSSGGTMGGALLVVAGLVIAGLTEVERSKALKGADAPGTA